MPAIAALTAENVGVHDEVFKERQTLAVVNIGPEAHEELVPVAVLALEGLAAGRDLILHAAGLFDPVEDLWNVLLGVLVQVTDHSAETGSVDFFLEVLFCTRFSAHTNCPFFLYLMRS